ncbi:MAG: release factor glutamine methyltransferase [Candidatus Parcubacteria bacterium]|jgi:release factor glutamine methyltransferase|nr:release factor glutamine methyltransferase [Candidatus Parcubacteria bacterium]
MSTPSPEDIRALRRDKYGDDPDADLSRDLERLASGEPLAYVIGWIPFLGLRIYLDSLPLIPRPETEWWTEKLVAHLGVRFGDGEFSFLDLCTGSGAIGLAVLGALPNARVTFAELVPDHVALIRKNLEENGLDASRAFICESDLFSALADRKFDVIAANPPYIPEGRALSESVTGFEPSEALFAGLDGLSLIRRIAAEAPQHLRAGGELWLECDTGHAQAAKELFGTSGRSAELHTDQYGRPRLLVSYW